MKNTMAEIPDEKDMNDILASIRQTITGELGVTLDSGQLKKKDYTLMNNHDHVLELTQEIQDDGTVMDLQKQSKNLKKPSHDAAMINNHLNKFDHKVNDDQPLQSIMYNNDKNAAERINIYDASTVNDSQTNIKGVSESAKHQTPNDYIDNFLNNNTSKSSSSHEQESAPIHHYGHEVKTETSEHEDQLLSNKTIHDSLQALTNLQKLSMDHSRDTQQNYTSQQTIESLVSELLKPLLKQWLDSHLPALVKSSVDAQIKRIIKEYRN